MNPFFTVIVPAHALHDWRVRITKTPALPGELKRIAAMAA